MQENISVPFFKRKKNTYWRFEQDVINKSSENINALPIPLLSKISDYLPNQDKTTFALLSKKHDKAVYKTRDWKVEAQRAIDNLKKICVFSFQHKQKKISVTTQGAETDFTLFIIILEYEYKNLATSKENVEHKGKIFAQALIAFLISPGKIKENLARIGWESFAKRIDIDKVKCLINQYLIRIYAENLEKKVSFEKLGSTINDYTNYCRKYKRSGEYYEFDLMNKVEKAIFDFQTKEKKSVSPANKAECTKKLAQQIRSIANTFYRSSHFWARFDARLTLFFGLIVFSLGLLLLATVISGSIAAFSASTLLVMTVAKIAAFFKLTADFFLGVTLASSTLLTVPVLFGGLYLFSQYSSNYNKGSRVAPEVIAIADAADEATNNLKM